MEKYKVGYCPGSFDMFHMGHLNLLRNSKSKCEYLIAGVVTDEVYMSYKLRPPVIPFEERLEIVAQCKYVDKAIGVTMELQDKWRAWEELHYDCHFAGSDHEGAWPDLEKRLEAVGSKLVFFPYTQSVSSTQIKKTLERDFVFRECMGEYKGATVVLFGAGAIADSFVKCYGAHVQPAFIVDNNSEKWGTHRNRIQIFPPEKLREIPNDSLYVIVCSRYATDIGKQLVEMGIRDYRTITQPIVFVGTERNRAPKEMRNNAEFNTYMPSEKQKQVWKVELDILSAVETICKKHNLRYFALHGTLLGAVRHKGFIPWDDDLDIGMLREDYDKFLAVAKEELPEYLFLQNMFTDEDAFFNGITRIRNSNTTGIQERELDRRCNKGIWVDILPIDNSPLDDALYREKCKKVSRYNLMLQAKFYGKEMKGAPYKVTKAKWLGYKLAAELFSKSYLVKKLDESMHTSNDENCELGIFTGHCNHRQLNRDDFFDVTYLDFEDRKLAVPVGYENYLFMVMGSDYMKLPPENEQKPKHRGIFDANRPYTEYEKVFCGMFDGVKGKKLVLFGGGMMFDDYMKKFGGKYRPDFIVDNDKNKWGRYRQGIEIKSPQEILSIPADRRKVIICSAYYPEIEKQLKEMGVTEYSIYIQHIEWITETEQRR